MTGGRKIQFKSNTEVPVGAFSITFDLYKAITFHKVVIWSLETGCTVYFCSVFGRGWFTVVRLCRLHFKIFLD